MTAFNDEQRDDYGVEPICRVVPIAPSTHCTHAARKADLELRPNLERKDDALCGEIRRVLDENKQIYGARSGGSRPGKGYNVARRQMQRLGTADVCAQGR